MNKHTWWGAVLGGVVMAGLVGCATEPTVRPDYGRPLPPGAPALLPLGPNDRRPDYAEDWRRRDRILPALDRSIVWTKKPSAPSHFPIAGVSHDRALRSLERFRELLATSASAADFRRAVDKEFTIYKSAGWDGHGGGVLFTGYCTPILDGSRERSDVYKYPLYGLPPDLVKDGQGKILGQKLADGSVAPVYPDRKAIDQGKLLAGKGLELAWMKDPLDAYIAHVNGSAVIRLPDGSLFHLGYAGQNGHEYTSLRNELVQDGKITEASANLVTMRQWAAEHPREVPKYLARNARYVFFTEIAGNPRGSLNVEVTAERSLATDKSLFPRGAVVFVDTRIGNTRSIGKRFNQFMLDQDTGGAIRTAGRADIYLGKGPAAERLAGTTQAEGQLYYLFLKS
ncbi:MAG: murein transglycosylase A [Planctomycetota bacterium]|jgi:membrane-bound lytic murein transglycosylase A